MVEAFLGNTLNDEFGFSTFKVDRSVQSLKGGEVELVKGNETTTYNNRSRASGGVW